ncbi:hypothetical protein [Fredinandcohnia onubensis]|uniref:hypothetical protein n=1 Tax=Fredinandcohnia onubensis TaxID=1571209 RepID=UPI000C0C08FF|nr:hypothetical protein [Fredinandcohnia onubensis]
MIPIHLIQAIFKSGAVQKLHSLSNSSQREQKTQSSSTNLPILLSANTSEISSTSQHSPLHQMDTVDLTSNDLSQFLQQQFNFHTPDNKNISLRMSGRKKNGEIDSDFCRLLFSLELKNLNEVVIDVKVQNRILSLVIYNQSEGIESIVSDLKSTLQTNLEPLGYQLSSVKICNPIDREKVISQTDSTKVHERVDLKI